MNKSDTQPSGQLPEGVGRKPNHEEMGRYAQFFTNPEAIPKLLQNDVDDFLYWEKYEKQLPRTPALRSPPIKSVALDSLYLKGSKKLGFNGGWNGGIQSWKDFIPYIPFVVILYVFVLLFALGCSIYEGVQIVSQRAENKLDQVVGSEAFSAGDSVRLRNLVGRDGEYNGCNGFVQQGLLS